MRARAAGVIDTSLIIAGCTALALVLVVAGAVLYVQNARKVAHDEGWKEGRDAALLEVARRDNETLVKANARIKELEAKVAVQQQQHNEAVQQIDEEGQRALRNLQAQHDHFLDDLLAGRIRVPGQGRSDASCSGGPRAPEGEALASAGVGDAASGGVVPQGFGKFLAAQASRADQVATQLTACQKIVVEDRRVCNGGP